MRNWWCLVKAALVLSTRLIGIVTLKCSEFEKKPMTVELIVVRFDVNRRARASIHSGQVTRTRCKRVAYPYGWNICTCRLRSHVNTSRVLPLPARTRPRSSDSQARHALSTFQVSTCYGEAYNEITRVLTRLSDEYWRRRVFQLAAKTKGTKGNGREKVSFKMCWELLRPTVKF